MKKKTLADLERLYRAIDNANVKVPGGNPMRLEQINIPSVDFKRTAEEILDSCHETLRTHYLCMPSGDYEITMNNLREALRLVRELREERDNATSAMDNLARKLTAAESERDELAKRIEGAHEWNSQHGESATITRLDRILRGEA